MFKYFDTDSSGYITPQNLRDAFAKSGKNLTEQEMKEILEHHDLEKNGIISFDEFRQIFFIKEKIKEIDEVTSPVNSIRKAAVAQQM